MKIKKLYTSAACAVALIIGYNSATYAMDAADADRAARIAQTRANAQRIGASVPDDADITPAVRDGYTTAVKVFKFYKDVRSAQRHALPDAEPADWERLAMDASRNGFSPLFQEILDRFMVLPSFNTVLKDSFLALADAHDPSVAPKAYTPSVMADCLEAFIADTNKIYNLNVKQRTLRAFLAQVDADIPVQTQQDVKALGLAAVAATDFPANRDDLREFLDQKSTEVHQHAKPLVLYTDFAEELLGGGSIDERLTTLDKYAASLADVAPHVPNFCLHNARLRDLVYVTELRRLSGVPGARAARDRVLATLQVRRSFSTLEGATGGIGAFAEHREQDIHVGVDYKVGVAKQLVTQSLQGDLRPALNDFVALRDEAEALSQQLDNSLQAALVNMYHTYKDIEYAKTH